MVVIEIYLRIHVDISTILVSGRMNKKVKIEIIQRTDYLKTFKTLN